MMGLAHPFLQDIPGLSFYKLMGSGKGLGFSPFPDWNVYALLQVWDSEETAEKFLGSSELMSLYDEHCTEHITFFMKNFKAHGSWSGQNPFKTTLNDALESSPIAIITRAVIKNRYIPRFWNYVPKAQKPVESAEGLLFTKGIGEMPVKHMATFSLWENLDSVKQFAYKSAEHAKAVRMTRELNWYSEELFARFSVYRSIGNWSDLASML